MARQSASFVRPGRSSTGALACQSAVPRSDAFTTPPETRGKSNRIGGVSARPRGAARHSPARSAAGMIAAGPPECQWAGARASPRQSGVKAARPKPRSASERALQLRRVHLGAARDVALLRLGVEIALRLLAGALAGAAAFVFVAARLAFALL